MQGTALGPVYIALSDGVCFHILFGDVSIGEYGSLGAAIRSASSDHPYGVSAKGSDWDFV